MIIKAYTAAVCSDLDHITTTNASANNLAATGAMFL
jgi:hypothetical protein